jgi:hypothetical protein
MSAHGRPELTFVQSSKDESLVLLCDSVKLNPMSLYAVRTNVQTENGSSQWTFESEEDLQSVFEQLADSLSDRLRQSGKFLEVRDVSTQESVHYNHDDSAEEGGMDDEAPEDFL